MAENWKITIVGGKLNGQDFSFPFDMEVMIGRSSRCQSGVQLPEDDISGVHLKLVMRGDVPTVCNISGRSGATYLNGVEMEAVYGEARVSAGDTIEIGLNRRVRIRMDAVPMPMLKSVSKVEVDAVSATRPTRWTGSSLPETAATAYLEETAVMTSGGTDATHVVEPTGGSNNSALNDETVIISIDGDQNSDPHSRSVSHTDDTDVPSGSTIVNDAPTPIIDPKVIADLIEDDKRKRRRRKIFIFTSLLLALGMFVGLWFVSRNTNETDMLSIPEKDGELDVEKYILYGSDGSKLIEVDYPRNDNMSVTVSPDSNGVSVVSRMGRDRDVPFFLQLETFSSAEELGMDLLTSAKTWISRAEESGVGYVFDVKVKDELKYAFFEDAFPENCESPRSLYGVKFVMFDYKRSGNDKVMWHGVLIYFRRGDTVFVHRREIPDFYWGRGAYQILGEPNIAIYQDFVNSYWESPGVRGLRAQMERETSELMESIRGTLAKERASDWRFVKKEIDAVLIKTWRTDPKTRALAEGCLKQFREVLRKYYYGKFNAFDTAKLNRDEKRMNRIRQDVAHVFDDPEERYYNLVGNGEIW